MAKKHKRRSHKVGLPAGTLMHIGEIKTERPELVLFQFDGDHLEEKTATSTADLDIGSAVSGTRWLNVYGLHDAALMAEIGRTFNLHPLVLEDILNTDQRPKLDTYDDYLFIVTRFFSYDKSSMLIGSEQVSIVLGRDYVLTFQERRTGSFDPIRERLRANKGHIRAAGAGYLAYALLDVIVDRYFIALEQLSDDCEALEDAVLDKPTASMLQSIHLLKRESIALRRAVWPLREVINGLIRNESGFFSHETVLYLRDVYDHTVHFIESLEALRDILAGMLDIYLSCISNRVNMEVRALTVMAMLFMPATLIAGIFGMNFKYMPFLQKPDGFWLAMSLMAAIAIVMGLIFWRRQWLSRH